MNLIFVYNANSGKLNAAFDSMHKVLSPKTYQCSLCNLTYGVFGEHKEWGTFISSTHHNFTFLHKDEYEELFQQKFSYPCILQQNESHLELLIDSAQLNKFESLEKLIDEITVITEARK